MRNIERQEGARMRIKSPFDRSTDDLAELTSRVQGSFLGRCVLRFLRLGGLDRCIVLSSQAFTALIPLLILAGALAPAGDENAVAESLIRKFGLSGDSADAVTQLFTVPAGGSSGGVGLFSAFLLLFSGVSFTRRLQRMYRAAWDQENAGVRSGLFAALGLVVLIVEVLVAYAARSLFREFPPDWLWALPVTFVTGLVLWTSIPYLLLNRQVHWRRLLFAGATAAAATTAFGAATTVYMPQVVTSSTEDFGLFGITISIIGWLLAAAGVLVASTVVGVEFDASLDPWIWRLKIRFQLYDPEEGPPAAQPRERRGLSRGDLLAIVRVLYNWMVMTAAVWAATALVPGINVSGGLPTYLVVSVILGLVNAVLGPLLYLAAFPLNALTFGASALVVNGVLLAVTAGLSERLSIDGLGTAVAGALVIAVVAALLELVLRPTVRGVTHGG
jgi:membrane protein